MVAAVSAACEIVCRTDDRAAWLEARRTGIGSSDAPAVLGVSPWSSPLLVYAEKIGEREDLEPSEAQEWGLLLEPTIIREFARETGRLAEQSRVLVRSTARPWQLATIDAEQEAPDKPGPGLLEVKATGFRAGDWSEGVPEHVTVQVQHQLDVKGYLWGSVAVLMNGCKMRWIDVERNEALIEKIREAEADFWQRVERREPVNPDGSPATREALRFLYPRDTGETIALPGEFIDLDDERCRLKDEAKMLDARLDEIDNLIKAAIGAATFGELANGVRYALKTTKNPGYSVEPFEFRALRRRAPKERA